MTIKIMATLWPEMPHWRRFAQELDGVRLNTAMADPDTLPGLVKQAVADSGDTPIYFDVKGRQLRVNNVDPRTDHLELDINHAISVKTPTMVIFKGGMDCAKLLEVKDGTRLVFEKGPYYNIRNGESLNIRDASLKIYGDLFTPKQKCFLSTALDHGIDRYMLSFVRSMSELDEMRQIVGPDAEIVAKIEDGRGLKFVKHSYLQSESFLFGSRKKKPKNTGLLCARGDLFVEVKRPHEIIKATEDIIDTDPDAILGSRILLSMTEDEVPSCADLSELAWLMDLGYKTFMFCDGLCLKEAALDRAVRVLKSVAESKGLK